jgi:hypothetical protein
MRYVLLLVCLLAVSVQAQDKTWVHTPSMPRDVKLSENQADYLYLEAEVNNEKTAGDVLPKPEQKDRTLYRTGQTPDDKWWGTFTAYDKSRFAMRGADNDLPWHRLAWDVTKAQLASALYDVYARVSVTPGGGCDLAFTCNDDKPENIATTDKANINWVPVGSIQITDQTNKLQLHIRTKKAAVRVDTVLLVKVSPKQVSVNLERFDITTPDWHKDKGLVFANDKATLGYRSNVPQHITDVSIAIRLKSEAPLQWQSLPAQSDGTWAIVLDNPGWYDVHLKAALDDGRELERDVTVAVLGEPIPEKWREKSVFGMWHVQGDKALINLAGARWDRAMTSFRDVTQEQANAAASASESAHPYAEKDGLAYTGVFSFGMPMWAMQMPDNVHKPSFGNPFYPAKDWSEVSRIVAAFARSRSLPLNMEMYNEPLAHWKGTHAQLVQYAHAVREGLRSVDPNFKLGGPCLYSIRIGDLNNLAKAGLFNELDSIVMHAYVDGTAPEDSYLERIVALNDLLKQYGQQDKPVYLTEFGWTAAQGTWQPPVDRWTQTRYIARSLALGWSQGVDAMMYFALRYNTSNTGEEAFSLMNRDNGPEPGYVSFAGVSRWFAASDPIGHYQLTPTTHMVIGRREGKLQIGLWDTAGQQKITLPFTLTKAVDMFGKPLSVASGHLSVSQDPIYVEALDQDVAALPTQTMITVTDLRDVKQQVVWPHASQMDKQASLKPGIYAAFSKVKEQWQVLPVSLVSPLHLTDVKVQWPTNVTSPQIQVTVQSNLADRVQDAVLWLDENPAKNVTLTIPALGMRQVNFSQDGFVLGKQSNTVLHLRLPDGKVLDQSLVWTPVVATPDSQAGRWMDFTAWAPFGKQSDDASITDCKGQTQISYSEKGLRLQVRVTDDEHHQTFAANDAQRMWAQDSIQVAMDMDVLKPWEAGVVGNGLAGHRVYEWTIGGSAEASSQGVAYRNRSYDQSLPVDTICPEIQAKVTRDGNVTSYDVLMPWHQLGLVQPLQSGDQIGFALAVNDVDPTRKAGRHGIRLFKGIVQTKDAKLYGKVWLR